VGLFPGSLIVARCLCSDKLLCSYSQGPLPDDEVCRNAFAEQLRKVIPAAKLPGAPAPGTLKAALRPTE